MDKNFIHKIRYHNKSVVAKLFNVSLVQQRCSWSFC